MPTATLKPAAPPMDAVDQIGLTAGTVYHLLDEEGPVSLTRLVKEIKDKNTTRDLVMQALGWLAREDKIFIDDEGRSKTVGLKW